MLLYSCCLVPVDRWAERFLHGLPDEASGFLSEEVVPFVMCTPPCYHLRRLKLRPWVELLSKIVQVLVLPGDRKK